jgi:deoxyribose-phosphate aldolase
MSSSEQLSERQTRLRAELSKVLELNLRQPDITTDELRTACLMAHNRELFGVNVTSARVLQTVAFLEDSTTKVSCIVGAETGAIDPDVKRFETEVAVDSGAHSIEVVPNPGRLREGDYASVLREFRDIVEAADERLVRIVLPVSALETFDFEKVLGLIEDSGADGLTLRSENALSGLTGIEAVRRARTLLTSRLTIKFDQPELNWDQISPLVEAGVLLFGSQMTAGVLGE